MTAFTCLLASTLAAADAPVRWTAQWPDLAKPTAGYALAPGAEHYLVFRATPGVGTYNHGANIAWHRGWFVVTLKSHARDEDLPGQRVLFSASRDGRTWQPARPLMDSINKEDIAVTRIPLAGL